MLTFFFHQNRFSDIHTKTYQFKIAFMYFKVTVDTNIFQLYYYFYNIINYFSGKN